MFATVSQHHVAFMVLSRVCTSANLHSQPEILAGLPFNVQYGLSRNSIAGLLLGFFESSGYVIVLLTLYMSHKTEK